MMKPTGLAHFPLDLWTSFKIAGWIKQSTWGESNLQRYGLGSEFSKLLLRIVLHYYYCN